jgi:hypothetical protein
MVNINIISNTNCEQDEYDGYVHFSRYIYNNNDVIGNKSFTTFSETIFWGCSMAPSIEWIEFAGEQIKNYIIAQYKKSL